MKNPFRDGDIVYHPAHEKQLIVCEVEDDYVRTREKGNSFRLAWMKYKELSFTPWPKANHERPIEDGWWVVTYRGHPGPIIREKRADGVVYGADGNKSGDTSDYFFHKYLGKSWK